MKDLATPDAGASRRRSRGAQAQRRGVDAERVARQALEADGWTILGQRLRTPAGEIDVVARRGDLVAMIEVKCRPTLSDAAYALSPRQRRRLLLAAEILLAANPPWSAGAVRFDVIVVDERGQARRIADAFRAETGDS